MKKDKPHFRYCRSYGWLCYMYFDVCEAFLPVISSKTLGDCWESYKSYVGIEV